MAYEGLGEQTRSPEASEVFQAAGEAFTAEDYETAARLAQQANELSPHPQAERLARVASERARERAGHSRAYQASRERAGLATEEPPRAVAAATEFARRRLGQPSAEGLGPNEMPRVDQMTPEVRADMPARMRRLPGTWVGGQDMPSRQVPQPAPVEQEASEPEPAPTVERFRAEPAPDQERMMVGPSPSRGGPDTGPGTESAASTAERARLLQALRASKSNAQKNRIIALIGALLGAKPEAVMEIAQSGRQEPLDAYRAESEGLRRIDEREQAQRSAQERRGLDQERLDMERQRLELARQNQDARLAQGERSLDIREQGQESLDAYRQATLAGRAGEATLRDPASAASAAAREMVEWAAGQVGAQIDRERLGEMSASEIRAVYPELLRAGQNRRRGGGGRGGGARRHVAGREAAVRNLADTYGLTDEDAQAMFDSLGRADQQRVIRDNLTRGARFGERTRERNRDEIRDRQTRYHNERLRQGFVDADASLSRVERAMNGLSDGQIRLASGAIGSPTAMNALEESDPRAAELARAFQRLVNVELKNSAGTAVTDSEFNRITAALGGGQILGGTSLNTAVRTMRRELDARESEHDRGYQDVLEQEEEAPPTRRNPGRAESGPAPRLRVRRRDGQVGILRAGVTREEAEAKGYEVLGEVR